MLVNRKKKIIVARRIILILSLFIQSEPSFYLMANDYPKKFKTQRPQSEKDRVLKVIQSLDPNSEYFIDEIELLTGYKGFGNIEITYLYQLNRHLDYLMSENKKIGKYWVKEQIKLPQYVAFKDLQYFFFIRDFKQFFQAYDNYVNRYLKGDVSKTKLEIKDEDSYCNSVFRMNEAMQKMYQSKGTADSTIALKVDKLQKSKLYWVEDNHWVRDREATKAVFEVESFEYIWKANYKKKNAVATLTVASDRENFLRKCIIAKYLYYETGRRREMAVEIIDLLLPEISDEKNYWLLDKENIRGYNDGKFLWNDIINMVAVCCALSGDYDTARQVVLFDEKAQNKFNEKYEIMGDGFDRRLSEIPR
jgi:hypothetical protein